MSGTVPALQERQVLKLDLKQASTASVVEWRTAMYQMLSKPRPDRALQETMYRSIMAYLDNLAAYQAYHHATYPGKTYVPPELSMITQWWMDCSCKAIPCVCGNNPTCEKAMAHFRTAMRQEHHRTGTTADTTPDDKAKQREVYEAAVKRVNNDITTALCQAVSKIPHLAHCTDIPAIKLNMENFGELSKLQLDNPNLLPLADLIQEILKHVRQGSTSRTIYKNIFKAPDPKMSLAQHEASVASAFDQITAMKITDAAILLDVIKAMSNLQFIIVQTSDATSPSTPKAVRMVYQRLYTKILKDIENDPQPFDMHRFAKFKEDLRIELASNDLVTGIDFDEGLERTSSGKLRNRQLSNTHPRKGPDPKDLKSLDLDMIWKLAQLTTRAPRGRGRGGGRGKGDNGGRGGKVGEGEYRGGKCFTCGSKGHPSHKCPNANAEAVREYEEKIKARNQARQLRRLAGDCAVSDDEDEEEWDEDDEGGAALGSVKPKPCLKPQHTATASQHTSHSVSFSPSITVRPYTPASRLPRASTTHWEKLVLKCQIVSNKRSRKRIKQQCCTLRSMKLTCQTNTRLNGNMILHQSHDISVMEMPATLVDNTKGVAVRSKHHNYSVVHMYPQQISIQRPPAGPVVDTGAQRSATSLKSEILTHTKDTFRMQGATGTSTNMCGILMGIETMDVLGKHLVIVAPDISVSNPAHADTLLSAGRFMEAGYKIVFRIPSQGKTDGYNQANYGGIFCTPSPDSRIIVMEYIDQTWRLPLPFCKQAISEHRPIPVSNTYSLLSTLKQPDADSTSEESDQRRFELQHSREREVTILHDVSHRHNRGLLEDLKAAGVETKHLQKYILAHRCKWCEANRGKRSYLVTTRLNDSAPLSISTIIDPQNPTVSITEQLATSFQQVSKEYALRPLHDLLKAPPIPDVPSPLPHIIPDPTPHMDLRMDWADAASLGWDGERYFLLIIDKTTEYLATFNTTSRHSPLHLLMTFINTTGRKPKYLRVDGAKEFVSEDIQKYCDDNNILLQIVVAYNHTMQARVEAAIGYVKQHSRISMTRANTPTRWWPDATKDFVTKKNFLWYSKDTSGKATTANERIQANFAGTRNTVNIPFGSRITSTIPREHRLVVNGSFGDRFVEGIYLYADHNTPCIHMYDFNSKTRMKVKDFKSYPEDFPFRDPTCLVRSTPTMTSEFAKMQQEDANDDACIAADEAFSALTRAQSKAIQSATSHPLPDLTSPPMPTIDLLPKPLPLSKSRTPKYSSIHLDTILKDQPEHELAKVFLQHNLPIVLPPHYQPGNMSKPEGEMVVVGVKVQKLSSTKSTLWVRFTSPPSYLGHQIQLYPKSFEPKRGSTAGADFSILSAIAYNHPEANTLRDLGVNESSSSDMTQAMLSLLNQYRAGTPFQAQDVDEHQPHLCSEQNPALLQVLADENGDSSDGPEGYTRSAQDPKHRGQTLAHNNPLHKEWRKSEQLEMDGLWKGHVLKPVKRSSLLPEDKVFGTRFHYKIKRKNGKFDKCKVRLVVQGQHMRKRDADGVGDFDDAFSPVPHASGFRLILSLATALNMFTDHVDISQAFTQGELLPGDGYMGKVYVSPPPGYATDPDTVWLLQKPLYGMPSAARAWHKTMSAFLHREGCVTAGFEKSMWTLDLNGHRILLAAHIDDFIIACADRATLDAFRTRLLEAFSGTYEGALEVYLGCEVKRDMITGTTILSQTHFSEDVLRTYGHSNSIPALTPFLPHTHLSKDDCDPNPHPEFHRRYRGIVGSLGYLVNMTRPDLAWSYSELSKYVQYPGVSHMAAADHVLRYLRGTAHHHIKYSRDLPDKSMLNILWGCVDSDWAGDTDTRRSHTGYVLMFNGGAVSWKSRRQDSVSLSTSEAEFVAASQCGQEVLYLREILLDFHQPQTSPTTVYEDNLACIAMSENAVRRKYSRHIDIRRYFVRELVAGGVLKLVPLRTHLMMADALTKGLPTPAHAKHRAVMMGHAPFSARVFHEQIG